MAKPIIVINIPQDIFPIDNQSELVDTVKRITDNEYHCIVVGCKNISDIMISTHNDCKGLPDIDIEQLIKTYTNGNN